MFPRLRGAANRTITSVSVSPQREANVAYANALMDTESGQRNTRKDSQEATARWIVASTGIVMTLLLGLAKDEGVFSSSASGVARVALVATVALGILRRPNSNGSQFRVMSRSWLRRSSRRSRWWIDR
jgi:hypothetical protein